MLGRPGEDLPIVLPGSCSHQDLLSGLRQPEGDQATSHQRSSTQKDGDHFSYPNEGSKDRVSQDGSKFAQSIEDAKCRGSAKKKNIGENFEVLDLTRRAALGSDLVIRGGVWP